MRQQLCFLMLILLQLALVLAQGAEPKPEAEPEPKPEPESEPEPENNSTKREQDAPSYAEPEPDWNSSKILWGSGWEIHIYFFGVTFGIVSLYSLLSIIRLWKRKHLLSQPYFISLNLLVFIMAACRCVYLLVDAYNSNHTFPHILAYILYTIFLPCVTSAFSLLFMSLLAATKMQFISPSIQKVKVIVFIIAVHFIIAITTDIMTAYYLDARVILFVCQMFYIVWGLFLFIGFVYIFGRLYKAAKFRQTLMNKYAMKKLGVPASKQNSKPEYHKLTLSLGTIVTLISSILGVLTVLLLIYGMVDVYGVFATSRTPESWRWYGYHTAFRAVELAICITISYVATQPFRYSSPNKSEASSKESCCSGCLFFFAPCWSWCNREHKYLLPDVGWSELGSESEAGTSLRRNESQKNDYPLHHVRGTTEDEKTTYNALKSPMLKADHGQLLFSSVEKTTDSTGTDNTYHVLMSHQEQATLKIDRDLPQESSEEADDTYNLLSHSEMCHSSKELNQVNNGSPHDSSIPLNIRLSQQSLDRVSQMSPELDYSDGEEMNVLIADV